MENQVIKAKSKYVRQSPYKVRLVLNLIRGLEVNEALNILSFTKRKAYTIHKHIYYPKIKSGSLHFELQNNKANNTIYIVDEASMISTNRGEGVGLFSQSLLDNIFKYVYSGFKC